MRSAVWTVRSVDEVFFASDTIIGRKKTKQKQHNKTRKNNIKQRKCIDFFMTDSVKFTGRNVKNLYQCLKEENEHGKRI